LPADHDPPGGEAPAAATTCDRVERDFTAKRPNQLWVTDLTYVPVGGALCYAAQISDAYSRLIGGWALAAHMRTELVLSALEMAIWRRGSASLAGLIHHSDKGCQYTAMRHTDQLSLHRIAASIGSVGDSYDNALVETTIGLYKTELTDLHGPWRGRLEVELASLEYLDWFNHRRVHGACGDVPPAEYKVIYYSANQPPAYADVTQ
jgi:putative transposase